MQYIYIIYMKWYWRQKRAWFTKLDLCENVWNLYLCHLQALKQSIMVDECLPGMQEHCPLQSAGLLSKCVPWQAEKRASLDFFFIFLCGTDSARNQTEAAYISTGRRDCLKEKKYGTGRCVYYLKWVSISHLWRVVSDFMVLLECPGEKCLTVAFSVVENFSRLWEDHFYDACVYKTYWLQGKN